MLRNCVKTAFVLSVHLTLAAEILAMKSPAAAASTCTSAIAIVRSASDSFAIHSSTTMRVSSIPPTHADGIPAADRAPRRRAHLCGVMCHSFSSLSTAASR
eukprot:279983-Prymnesium_polylepis.1